MNLSGDGGSAVCVGSLASELGAEVFSLETRVAHGVGDGGRLRVGHFVGVIVHTAFLPPRY